MRVRLLNIVIKVWYTNEIMVKTFSYIIYKILRFLNILFFKITNRSFLIWFSEFIEKDSIKNLNILIKIFGFLLQIISQID